MGWTAGTATIAVGVLLIVFLLRPKTLRADTWRATATPLASIIGSGFLVSVPILRDLVGAGAIWVMAGLLLLAYLVGAAVRENIVHVEPLLADHHAYSPIVSLERLSHLVLSFAYFVSVAYYLVLFASFLLQPLGLGDRAAVNALVTALLAAIGTVGLLRGFGAVERLEVFAVSAKLAVIAGMLAGLIAFDLAVGLADAQDPPAVPSHLEWPSVPVLFGLLILVQGFETSRFLGDRYDAALRVRTMKYAQALASAIYLAFFALMIPLLGVEAAGDGVAAIVDMLRPVSVVLPPLVVAGALASQSSAAIADALGAGGLLHNLAGGRIGLRYTYPVIALIAIVVTWETNVYSLITLASRCFAVYYLMQCLVAALSAHRRRSGDRAAGFAALALACAAVALLGTPAEGG